MATRGLKPRGRTVALAFDEGLVGLVGRLAEPINLADAQNTPASNISPPSKRTASAPSLACRSFSAASCWACWWSSSASCVSLMKAKSLSSSPSPQMAAILSQSQLNALFGQYRQTRIRALPASSGVAIAEGWMDVSLPLMEQVYEASTLDTASERERLTGALEEAANEFRRYSKRYAAGAQKRRRRSSISTRTCSLTPACVASCCRS